MKYIELKTNMFQTNSLKINKILNENKLNV